jgi:serine/threonine protein kinase
MIALYDEPRVDVRVMRGASRRSTRSSLSNRAHEATARYSRSPVNCPHCNVFNPDDARFCAACGKATSATEPVSHPHMKAVPEMIGKEIAGRYRIQAKLGEGGMGAVYKAEQISLKRQCAVKVLRPDVAGTAIMLARFNAEAQAVAKLSHPNTVGIYDFGQDTDGSFFIAMEFVEGTSLRETLHAEAVPCVARCRSRRRSRPR